MLRVAHDLATEEHGYRLCRRKYTVVPVPVAELGRSGHCGRPSRWSG